MSLRTRPFFRASQQKLLLECLEPRINFSALAALPTPFHDKSASHALHRAVGGDAASLSSANAASIAADSYSRIFHARLDNRGSGPAIAFWRGGGYVEYTVTVPTTGSYALQVAVASMNGASFSASIDGKLAATFTTAATGHFDKTTLSQTINLQAGTQFLRFTLKARSPSTLSGFELQYEAPPAPAPLPVTVSSSSGDAPIMPSVLSVTERTMTSFTELDVAGVLANANILVTQSGNTLTITGNSQKQQITGTFGTLVVYAGTGNSTVNIDPSVTIPTTVYGGTGNDIINDATQGQAAVVTLDGGADTVSGNGINTAFWVDPADTVVSSGAERAIGGVHIVGSVYQPFSSIVGDPAYVTSVRDGSNLVDPAALGPSTMRLASSSFWGTGPAQEDVNQGNSSDCYYLTSLQSLARLQPARLEQMGVDLGDGTYLVEFQRGGAAQYVRVDGDLPSYISGGPDLMYAHPGVSGNEWAPIFEKAYAYFRKGANSYASLDNGFMTSSYLDLGVNASTFILPSDQTSFLAMVNGKLGANLAVDVLTSNTIGGGAPLVPSHTYSVLGASQDVSGNVWVTIRNPWGNDGFNVDSNPNDGILTISYATLTANSFYGSCMI